MKSGRPRACLITSSQRLATLKTGEWAGSSNIGANPAAKRWGEPIAHTSRWVPPRPPRRPAA